MLVNHNDSVRTSLSYPVEIDLNHQTHEVETKFWKNHDLLTMNVYCRGTSPIYINNEKLIQWSFFVFEKLINENIRMNLLKVYEKMNYKIYINF